MKNVRVRKTDGTPSIVRKLARQEAMRLEQDRVEPPRSELSRPFDFVKAQSSVFDPAYSGPNGSAPRVSWSSGSTPTNQIHFSGPLVVSQDYVTNTPHVSYEAVCDPFRWL